MEDRHIAVVGLGGDPHTAFFGGFDGHGGKAAAEFATNNMPRIMAQELLQQQQQQTPMTTIKAVEEEAMRRAYLRTDADFSSTSSAGGAYCVTALLHEGRLMVSNAVLYHAGKGSLAMSRGIGDGHLKPWVLAEPDTTTLPVDASCEFLVLASDGLWDKVDAQEAVDVARLVSVTSAPAAPPPWLAVGGLHCKGLIEKTPLPSMGQIDRGHQHVFQRDYNFTLPRNGTIFDIDIDAFQQKPWRQQGVDLTDYFNFSLDEEGWRKYWCSMKQLRLGARSLVNETSGLEQESYKLKSVKAMSKVANDSGSEGRNGLGKVNMTLSPSNQSTSDDSSKLNYNAVATERHAPSLAPPGSSPEVVARGGSGIRGGPRRRRSVLTEIRGGPRRRRRGGRRAGRLLDGFPAMAEAEEEEQEGPRRAAVASVGRSTESMRRTSKPRPVVDPPSHAVLHRPGHPLGGARGGRRRRRGVRLCRARCEADAAAQGPERVDLLGVHDGVHVLQLRLHADEREHDGVQPGHAAAAAARAAGAGGQHAGGRPWDLHRRMFMMEVPQRVLGANLIEEILILQGINLVVLIILIRFLENQKKISILRDPIDIQNSGTSLKTPNFRMSMSNLILIAIQSGKRRAIDDRSVDVEFSRYTDYRFCERQSPEVRGRYRDKGRFAKSNDGHFRHANHLELYPGLNNYEGDRPATGFPSMSSRNRCINNKKVRNAKTAQNNCHGYHQKNKQHDSSFCIGNIPRSALQTDTYAETGHFVLPIKRKLHSDLGPVDQKTLADLPLLKGRRLMHGQSIVSDRRIYALKLHKSTEKINTEVICSFKHFCWEKT
ncbi:unnamed protein product [Miscanthus lutarioriparius]|uniref:protein-serine/threonine phosphatase n=1 Tax=Miscanthus lutarioriparius TaxID=422564 RepID=A0A811M9R3_9POAL|nr:unnamed protein product [Miscanthus lutarioriparius]